jgi:hypothetical protein
MRTFRMRMAAVIQSVGRCGRATGLVVILFGVVCFPAVAVAKLRLRPTPPVVPGTAFTQRGTAFAVISDRRYAFAAPMIETAPGVLFDDLHHRRMTISGPACALAGGPIAGGVLPFNCSQSIVPAPELYVIASRRWRSVAANSSIAYPCGAGVACDTRYTLTGAGSRWLQFRQDQCPQGEHCGSVNVFENIQTGAVAQDPAVQGGNQLPNLDSPQLAQRICSPLTIPAGFNLYGAPGRGDLTIDGQFAVASTPGPRGGSRTYLERCGTHLHQLIASTNAAESPGPVAVAISPHAIVWQQSPPDINVEFLPSRRRYRLRLPRTANPIVSELALTDNHLEVVRDLVEL